MQIGLWLKTLANIVNYKLKLKNACQNPKEKLPFHIKATRDKNIMILTLYQFLPQ